MARALPSGGSGLLYAMWLPLLGLVGVRVGLGSGQNRKEKIAAGALACLLFADLAFLVACGSSSGGTPAGTYTITVTGVSNTLKHTAITMLKVQ